MWMINLFRVLLIQDIYRLTGTSVLVLLGKRKMARHSGRPDPARAAYRYHHRDPSHHGACAPTDYRVYAATANEPDYPGCRLRSGNCDLYDRRFSHATSCSSLGERWPGGTRARSTEGAWSYHADHPATARGAGNSPTAPCTITL